MMVKIKGISLYLVNIVCFQMSQFLSTSPIGSANYTVLVVLFYMSDKQSTIERLVSELKHFDFIFLHILLLPTYTVSTKYRNRLMATEMAERMDEIDTTVQVVVSDRHFTHQVSLQGVLINCL